MCPLINALTPEGGDNHPTKTIASHLGRIRTSGFFRGRTTKCRWPHALSRRISTCGRGLTSPGHRKTRPPTRRARGARSEEPSSSRIPPLYVAGEESIPSTSGHAYHRQHFAPLRGACGQTCFCVRFAVSAAVKQWSGRANQSK